MAIAKDQDVQALTRHLSADDLRNLGRVAEAVAALVILVNDPTVDAETHRRAIVELRVLDRQEAVQALRLLAKDPGVHVETRRRAAMDLGEFVPAREFAEIMVEIVRQRGMDSET